MTKTKRDGICEARGYIKLSSLCLGNSERVELKTYGDSSGPPDEMHRISELIKRHSVDSLHHQVSVHSPLKTNRTEQKSKYSLMVFLAYIISDKFYLVFFYNLSRKRVLSSEWGCCMWWRCCVIITFQQLHNTDFHMSPPLGMPRKRTVTYLLCCLDAW